MGGRVAGAPGSALRCTLWLQLAASSRGTRETCRYVVLVSLAEHLRQAQGRGDESPMRQGHTGLVTDPVTLAPDRSRRACACRSRGSSRQAWNPLAEPDSSRRPPSESATADATARPIPSPAVGWRGCVPRSKGLTSRSWSAASIPSPSSLTMIRTPQAVSTATTRTVDRSGANVRAFLSSSCRARRRLTAFATHHAPRSPSTTNAATAEAAG